MDSPNERRPRRYANRTEPNSETARPTSVNGSQREGRHECFGDNVETNCELSELAK